MWPPWKGSAMQGRLVARAATWGRPYTGNENVKGSAYQPHFRPLFCSSSHTFSGA